MPFRCSPARRSLAARIALLHRDHPDDPTLPGLRDELDRLAIEEIRQWAEQARQSQAPFNRGEILQVARQAKILDARRGQAPASYLHYPRAIRNGGDHG